MIAVFEQALIAGVGTGAIYALIAFGISLTWSVSKTLNFAHGDIAMVGVFVSLACIAFGVPGPVAVVIAIVVGAILGVALNGVVFRPLHDRKEPLAWLLGVVIVAAIIRSLGIALFESRSYPAPFDIAGPGSLVLPGGGVLRASYLWILIIAVAMGAALHLLLSRSAFGRCVRVVAASHELAETLGIDSKKVMAVTFAVAAAVGTMAGTLVAPITFVSVGLGWMFTLKAFTASVIGGIGDGRGALLGGLMLGVIEQMLVALELVASPSVRGFFSAGIREAFVFLILIAFLIARPQGLFGRRGDPTR